MSLFAAGARYGTKSAKELLPHPTTVNRKAAQVAGDLRETLRPVIKAAMEEGHCSMTVNMWTDDYKKTAYIAATAHYVNDDWELISLKKTGDNIQEEFVWRCAKLGMDEGLLESIVFVTDHRSKRHQCTSNVQEDQLRRTHPEHYPPPHLRRCLLE
ncbi:hypothetical protein HPB49_003656 [Dermacentor silvarum]|uniref:Uncharacterized protein n=1 Tax=Dermacentor silvarum TaxID=543639 RepID=A0ACB8CPM9_DERSI|nr:hypothetical protein HPB49_003656 [Dermacentor silvarum]